MSEDRSRAKNKTVYKRKKSVESTIPTRKRRRVIIDSSSSSEEESDTRNETTLASHNELTNLLGDDPSANSNVGPPLDSEIVVRWCNYLSHGFDKDSRDLWSKHPFPENCPLLEGPKLNPEIEAILSPSDIKKDGFLLGIQSKLGKGLTFLGYALGSLIRSSDSNESTRNLVEASKMLCETHFLLSNHIKHQIYPFLKDEAALKIATEAKSDTWLFGTDFSQKSRDAQAIQKTAADLGLKKTSRNVIQKPSTSYGSLNARRQFPKPKMKFSTEKFARVRRAKPHPNQERYQRYRRDRRN